ncbi:unnamed protein product, partial [Prorocentrum cordatum]
ARRGDPARGAAPPGWLDGGRGQASEVAGDPAGEVGDPPRTAAPPARPGAPRAPSATPPPCSGRSQCRGRSAGHDDGAQAGEPRVAHPSRLVRAARGRAARERLGPQGRCLAPRAASRGRAGGPLRVGGGPAPPGRAAHQGAVQRSARRRHWWIARRPRRTECLSERSARWRRWWIARRPLRTEDARGFPKRGRAACPPARTCGTAASWRRCNIDSGITA